MRTTGIHARRHCLRASKPPGPCKARQQRLAARSTQTRQAAPAARGKRYGAQPRTLTGAGLVAREGDVELAVLWQVEGLADGERELAVAVRAGGDLGGHSNGGMGAWLCALPRHRL